VAETNQVGWHTLQRENKCRRKGRTGKKSNEEKTNEKKRKERPIVQTPEKTMEKDKEAAKKKEVQGTHSEKGAPRAGRDAYTMSRRPRGRS